MNEDDDEDADDDPQPDAFSTLYDPLAGLRERWMTRLNWWQKTLLIVGAFVIVVVFCSRRSGSFRRRAIDIARGVLVPSG